MTQIAFLGTGLLGAAFAEAAARRGDAVTVWNRSSDKARALEAFGATAAATPAEAVRGAQRVHLVLKDDAVVEDVLAQARDGLAPGVVIVDHSTTLPRSTAARVQRFNAAGVHYLHCPVFMGPDAARKAQGTILVAGPKAAFDSVQADLARMTARLQYLGERADLAAAHKLCGNALIIGLGGLVADILTIAAGAGLDAQQAISLLGTFDLDARAQRAATTMAERDFTATFELTMARKDLALMLQTAAGRPMAALAGVAARMDQLIATGHGHAGTSVLAIDAR